MSIDESSKENSTVLHLDSVLDLRAATPLAEALKSGMGKPVVIDASNVERIGGQCLQVLIAAHKTWGENGHPFSIENPSEAFVETLALMGASLETFTNDEAA